MKSEHKMVESRCEQCGSDLFFKPGENQLECPYCNHSNPIEQSYEEIEEQHYHTFLERLTGHHKEDMTIQIVTCDGCGAEVSVADGTSQNCPYCDTPQVAEPHETTIIAPKGVLPFKITAENGNSAFRNWTKKLWFAPRQLKKNGAEKAEALSGMYVPYWTYDSETETTYTGQRGTEYTTRDSEGNTRTDVRWRSVSGRVNRFFDDILLMASNSLPGKIARKLEPWDLENLQPYDGRYLLGFRSEKYQVGLKEGFDIVRESVMSKQIDSDIRYDIGGDRQRITSKNTSCSKIRFKHILLPIWICSYRFKGKIYRFLINGRTGEVQGERPWSVIKITLAALGAIAIGIGIYIGYLYLS